MGLITEKDRAERERWSAKLAESYEGYDHDERFKQTIEEVVEHPITVQQYYGIWQGAYRMVDEEENGDEQWQATRRLRRNACVDYLWSLLEKFDDVEPSCSHRRAKSERMKRIWRCAHYMYGLDDPSGNLGPSKGEVQYLFMAMQAAIFLGDESFTDIMDQFKEDTGHRDFYPIDMAYYNNVKDLTLDTPEEV